MKLTDEQRIAKHKSFLQANWNLIGAFAWEHFQEEGRGAVFVPEEDFIHSKHTSFASIGFRYFTEKSEAFKIAGGWPGDKECDWVQTYDPSTHVVILVVGNNGGISSYLINGAKSPPEAFAAKKAADN